MYYILDTNILLSKNIPDNYEKLFIPFRVLEELDKLKQNQNEELKYKAREALRKLYFEFINDKVLFSYEVTEKCDLPFDKNISDNLILLQAFNIYTLYNSKSDNVIFLTEDLNLHLKAKTIGMKSVYVQDSKKELYLGYKEVMMTDSEYCDFCTEFKNNFGLVENEYLIIYQKNGEIFDKYRWTSEGFKTINTRSFKSRYFGTTKPLDSDVTQALAFDSLYSTDMTLLYGRAGCGKTHIALSYLMSQLENSKIDKLYIVHSFEPLKNAKTLGFLPGSKDEKIFGSGIGNILSSKFCGLEQTIKPLIQSNKLEIIPTADIRGVEFGENDAMFITEAQNIDPYTMKTCIQRCKTGCKIVIEGDMLEQKDTNSILCGMDRVIDIFKGTKYFSCVKLEKNNRNPIGELADKI